MISEQSQMIFMNVIESLFLINSPSMDKLLPNIIKILELFLKNSNVSEILNSEMVQYNHEKVTPLMRVMFLVPEDSIFDKNFYDKKYSLLILFDKYGINFDILNNKIPERLDRISRYSIFYLMCNHYDKNIFEEIETPSQLDVFERNRLIDNKIKEYLISKFNKKITITI
jgi:hypothetical protein